MKDKAKAMVMASFAGDALALGAHWIYDPEHIERKLGRIEQFHAPLKDSFHTTKTLGDLTHYGDQTLCLLQSIAEHGGFEPVRFLNAWRDMIQNYSGYRDHATRTTLKRLGEGASFDTSGSSSSDLGGASRIAPLVYLYVDDPDQRIAAARTQTAMTHNNPQVIESAGYFADVAAAVLAGEDPLVALEGASKKLSTESLLYGWIQKGLDSVSNHTRDSLASFGLSCEVNGAFPGIIHLIAKYPNDLKEALVENVMAGGDSAARGLLVGMILGAYLGKEAIPESWIAELNCRDSVLSLLERIDANRIAESH